MTAFRLAGRAVRCGVRRFAGVVCFCLVLLGAACGAGKPPQPLTVQELALQPAGAETVRVAYDYLLSDYLQPLHPQDLLAAAWAGVQQQARAGGADAGDAPTLRGSPTGDFAAFAAAFNRVTAGKDAAPYAFAAVKAMAQSLHDDHTTLVPADLYKQALALLQGGDTQLPLLQSRMLPGGIGYLRLLIFPAPYVKLAGGKTLAESLDAALDAFEQQGVKGWVLDLRGNAGGAIDSVSTLTGRFIPNGVVSALRSRHGVRAEELADGHYYPHRHPLAVLIDGNSASASELAASALRDYGAARLFGQKTAGAVNGAGLVPLPGQAALEYTVFTALDGFSSTPLDKVGVQPDQPTAGRVGSTDPALSAASAWLAGLGASAQPPSASAAPRGTALTAAQVGQTLGGYSAQVADVAATPDLKLLGELAIDAEHGGAGHAEGARRGACLRAGWLAGTARPLFRQRRAGADPCLGRPVSR